MIIGGLQNLSLIDFPGKLSCVIFTQGCPFRCHYCHNKQLVLPHLFQKPINEPYIFDFLEKRKNILEGIVISGGEPTIQKDLQNFIKKIKKLGFLVKLDTSGTNPLIIRNLLKHKLIDYIAMDIKAPLEKYEKITNIKIEIEDIKESIDIILENKIPYEFRTTIVPELLDKDDLVSIAKLIRNANLYVLQQFVPTQTLNPLFQEIRPFSSTFFIELTSHCRKFVNNCICR